MNRLLKYFTLRDLIFIAAMASLGIVIKPVATSLVHLISSPLGIPGGSLAGGLYMMWIVVAFGLTGKRGSATLTGLVQAIIVMITGVAGSHGIMSLVSYTLPRVAVDAVILIFGKHLSNPFWTFVAGMAANVTGTICVNFVFFSLPLIPFLLSIFLALFSGGAGGLLAYAVLKRLSRYGIYTVLAQSSEKRFENARP